jgi:hypothetical protein
MGPGAKTARAGTRKTVVPVRFEGLFVGATNISESESFPDLLPRLRAGDEQAAANLVVHYEGVIRREARFQMTNPGLGRLLDSVDICQSVLASFFARAAAGQYDLDRVVMSDESLRVSSLST